MAHTNSDGSNPPRSSLLSTRMVLRSRHEEHRVSTPLELLFDLTFVVAVSQAASELSHALADGHIGSGVTGYLEVFFAIWWAWINFTWFASAYDTDDVIYRLTTMAQMAGVLVLAAGVPSAFEKGEFASITIGYVIMRVAMVGQWLRAARSDPTDRRVALRYAAGVSGLQILWVVRLAVPHALPTYSFVLLAIGEMATPIWAERASTSTEPAWHPHHIAERYGLFTIIVLGECILAATVAVQNSLHSDGVGVQLLLLGFGGLALVFGLWWLYFLYPAGEALNDRPNVAFLWGYGHYGVFAAGAALGAGLEVTAEALHGHIDISDRTVGYCVAIPVAVFLVLLHVLFSKVLGGQAVPGKRVGLALVFVLLIPLATTGLGLGGVTALIALAPVTIIMAALFQPSPARQRA